MEIPANYAAAKYICIALLAKIIPISDKWIIDSGAANHRTGNRENLFHKTKYKRSRMIITVDNTRFLIKSDYATVIMPRRRQ